SPVERQVEAVAAPAKSAPAAAPSTGRSTRTALAGWTAPRRSTGTGSARRWTSRTGRSKTAGVPRFHEGGVLIIAGGELAPCRATQPQIPVQGFRHGRGRRDLRHPLRPARPSGPGMHFLHFADLARPKDFARHARRVMRVALVAHLGGDLRILLRRL